MSPTITALSAQKRNPRRINVYLDGEFAFGLERIVAAWLNVGRELSAADITRLQAEDQREAAYQRAVAFLDRRMRSEAEVRRHLAAHQVDEAVIAETIERLTSNGLLNDPGYAQAWIENRSEFRPRSQRALAYELRRRGLSEQTVRQALQQADLDEAQQADQAARRHLRRLHGLERAEFIRKLSAYLARRGFPYEVVTPLVRRLWEEQESPQDL
jgi:regulatory protein